MGQIRNEGGGGGEGEVGVKGRGVKGGKNSIRKKGTIEGEEICPIKYSMSSRIFTEKITVQ